MGEGAETLPGNARQTCEAAEKRSASQQKVPEGSPRSALTQWLPWPGSARSDLLAADFDRGTGCTCGTSSQA